MAWMGFAFASPLEAALAAVMLLPLLFFALCALYLLRLMLAALPMRERVAALSPPVVLALALPDTGQDVPAVLITSLAAAVVPAVSLESAAPVAGGSKGKTRFLLLLPAHNEELLLGAALTALQTLDYPRALYEIVVIADNCTDSTAAIARQSNALALERADETRIGKGYALEDTLAWLMPEQTREQTPEQTLAQNSARNTDTTAPPVSLGESPAEAITVGSATLAPGQMDARTQAAWERARQFEAVVILDADTFVSPNLLTSFNQALGRGERVIQARYDVLNTGDSWRTRLMSCALALAHVVKPLGRDRLRLSDGLKGNGMCFGRDIVVTVPWSGESITEDIEYTLRVCRAGHRVAFAPDACVWAQMPTTGAQAASQRQRWEGGRYQLVFKVAPRLWRESARTGNRLLRDRAIELIVPPFAEMFALPFVFGMMCALCALLFHWRVAGLLASMWALILGLQAVYLLGGMWIARVPASVALSLLRAPFYIVWKLGLYVVMALGRGAGGWKRTERHELSK